MKKNIAAVAILSISLLIAIIFLEFFVYPVSYKQIKSEMDAKTTGTILVLVNEEDIQLHNYKRALLLPRYRLKDTTSIDNDGFVTANKDWFHVYAIEVQDGYITLHDIKPSINIFAVALVMAIFEICLYKLLYRR